MNTEALFTLFIAAIFLSACGLILNGRLQVTVGEQTTVLRDGDACDFKSSYLNPGNEPCELISARTWPTL